MLRSRIYLSVVFRYLEWDYGSDLGYLDGQVSQVEAAQSLSTLEKLAIGSYSEYLRDPAQAPPTHGLSRYIRYRTAYRAYRSGRDGCTVPGTSVSDP